MAIDETYTHSDSTFNTDSAPSKMSEWKKKPPVTSRMGQLIARKQRIEHWAYGSRIQTTGSDRARSASISSRSVSQQKRSESLYSQSARKLSMHLMELGERREKVIDQHNFDQKLFANKQALKHKENPLILSTLNYVRKCCKYVDKVETEENSIDPTIFLEENALARRARSRSPSATPPPVKRPPSNNSQTQTSASLAQTFLEHNRKHLESYRKSNNSRASSQTPSITQTNSSPPIDDETQKRHVQFQIQAEPYTRNTMSAFEIRKSSASRQVRSTSSAPLIRPQSSSTDTTKSPSASPQPRRSLSRIRSARSCLEEFRLHPERFLSPSNRYLPLLRRQAIGLRVKDAHGKAQGKAMTPSPSRLSDGSDTTYDDAKSFLSEETEFARMLANFQVDHERRAGKRSRPSSKLDMMEAPVEDDTERQMAIARLRDREYAHMTELIQSHAIETILEPFSPMKTDEHESVDSEEQKRVNMQSQSLEREKSASTTVAKIRPLKDLMESIDSLRCSDMNDRRARRQVDLEKNRAKLGILIF